MPEKDENRESRQEDRESRQNQLIDAATTLFFSKGYTNTSVRDILDEANDRTSSPSVFIIILNRRKQFTAPFCAGTPSAM